MNQKRLLNRFLEYVKIDSETGHEEEIQQRLLSDFAAMGVEASCDYCGDAFGSNSGNVFVRLEGDSQYEPLLFCAHVDTVSPGKGVKPQVCQGYITSDGTTVLGSDDKSGVAAIVEAIQTLQESQLPHRTIEAVFTISEEGGLHGSNAFDTSLLQAKMGVVLDSGGPVGHCIVSAPGKIAIEATVTGKAAHAGTQPECGISAIQVMSHAIAQMKLLRIDEDTTANIGSIEASYPTNIVAESCTMQAECRSLDTEKLYAQSNHMEQCLRNACHTFGAVLNYQATPIYLGYTTQDHHPMLELLEHRLSQMGLDMVKRHSGGGSDTNIFRQKGIFAVNLGVGMEQVHSKNERIGIKQMEAAAELLILLALTDN